MAGLLLLSACNSTAADPIDAESATAAPADAVSPTATPSPPPSGQPSPTPTPPSAEDAVEDAYARFLRTTVDAMAAGDVALIEGATGQALAAAQGNVAALLADGRLARGSYRLSVEALTVEADSARLRDCQAHDLTEHNRETGEQVADRNGTRFVVQAELERTEDGWVVTQYDVGDFCVPDELAREISRRYVAFWSAVVAAGRPPDPDHPDLAETAAGEQLEGLRAQLIRFRDQRQEIRDTTTSNPEAVRITRADTVAFVRDCRDLDPGGGIYDTTSGELVHGGAEPGQRDLWETRLELVDGRWVVVDADLIEEDSACVPASS